ncbi:MAG: hypothetical protein ACYS26_20455 [Planctomycetota bacterium]|jgi:hypothetical protein
METKNRCFRVTGFNRQTAVSLLADIHTSARGRAEANDYVVREIREAADHAGFSRAETEALLREEMHRARKNNVRDLDGYLKLSRHGSRYRVSRTTKLAVFVLLVSRGLTS